MSQDTRHRIIVYAQTDVGMVRAGNEDTFLVLNLETSDTWTPATVEGDPPDQLATFVQGSAGTILAVSDGMGGALAGEVASRMAVEGVREHMLYFQTSDTFAVFPFHERLRLAVEQANTHINNESMGNADYAGMGATFTAAGVHDGVLTLAQIGDSRCYLIRNGRIALVTHDQSLVWQLVEAGHITEEEAETHQYKNVILQALGAQPRVNVVVDRIPINDGDVVLLCSDGLSGRVKADEMLDIVTKAPELKDACEQLIQLANDRGGEDNITVVLARFEGDGLPTVTDVMSERVERDPNLPYDVADDTLGDVESTLSPEQLADTDPQVGTAILSSTPTAENEAIEPSETPTGGGAADEISPDLADQIALLNEKTEFTVPTAVGIPAITPEMLAERAKMLAEAEKAKKTEPASATSKKPDSKGSLKGPLVAVAFFAALLAVAWYVYSQQAQVATERATLLSQADSVSQRASQARHRLGTLQPDLERMTPGPHHTEAMQLRTEILSNLDAVSRLVQPGAAKPETLSEAESLCNRIDGDLSRLDSIILSGNSPQQPAAAPPNPS
jgi:protein phosphatase